MSVKLSRWFTGAAITLSLAGHAVAAESTLTVFAAASLTNALQDIATQYQQKQPVKIVSSFASSSTLARQIEQGAPADLFISADQQWMDYAIDKHSVDKQTRYTLLGNDLVLIAPTASHPQPVVISNTTDWKNLLNGQRLAVGDPDHVPAGIYTRQALEHLGAWQTLSPLMARANNVRAALALVERDETPYGVVYGSDAVASSKVTVVGTFPADSHLPVEYPMAIVSPHPSAAVSAFFEYLKSPEASAIFKRYGFTPRT